MRRRGVRHAGLAAMAATVALGCGDESGAGASGPGGGGPGTGGGATATVGAGGYSPGPCIDFETLRVWEAVLTDASEPGAGAAAEVLDVAGGPTWGALAVVEVATPVGEASLFRLGGADLTSARDPAGSRASFVVALDGAGIATWVTALSGSGAGAGRATRVRAAPDGGAFVVGWFSSDTFRVGSVVLTRTNAAPGSDAFAARLAPDGSVAWAVAFHGDGGDDVGEVGALAVGADGTSTFSIDHVGDLVVGPSVVAGSNTTLLQLDASGVVGWSLPLVAGTTTRPIALVPTTEGALLAVGGYDAAFQLGDAAVGKDPFLGDQVYALTLSAGGTPLVGAALKHPVAYASDYQRPLAATESYVVAAGVHDDGAVKSSFVARLEVGAFTWSVDLPLPTLVAGAAQSPSGGVHLFGSGPPGTCEAPVVPAVLTSVDATGAEAARSVVALQSAGSPAPRALDRTGAGQLVLALADRVVLADPP